MDKLVIVGYSGHAYVVIEAAQKSGLQVVGYTEKINQKNNPYGLDYMGFEGHESFSLDESTYSVILGIGNNLLRESTFSLLKKKQFEIRNVFHPSSELSISSNFKEGVFISSNVQVNAMSQVGNGVILNTSCVIEHECKIGDFSHIAPAAVLAGNVQIGRNTFIGANTSVKEGVKIGDNVIVGAGSVVIRDIESNKKLVGNPTRFL